MEKIPSRYLHTVVPHLMVKNAAAAIEFYKTAFGAEELFRLAHEGFIFHAELRIENSTFMVGEAAEPFIAPPPVSVGLHIYVENVDLFLEKAQNDNIKVLQPIQDMFYGDRQVMLQDPFGHIWVVLSRVEDLTIKQIEEKSAEFFSKK